MSGESSKLDFTTCSNASWRELSLEHVAEITVGHVGLMASEYVASGIPFLRSQNVDRLQINTHDLKRISDEFHARLGKSALSPGDVVIVRTGKPGTCAVIPDWLQSANCSDLVIVRCKPELDPYFLAYFVNSSATRHIDAHLVGAVQQHFNVGAARTIRILLPSITEQKRLVAILRALDDKIELNRRMNETLEAMARALFRSWFVDFDPVRAKAVGRQPVAMDSETAKLFPQELVDSALGLVPLGWRVAGLGEVMELKRGYDLPSAARVPGAVPIVSSSGPSGLHNEAKVRAPGVVTGRYGTIGQVFLLREDFWPLNTTLYVKDFKGSDVVYAYHHLARIDFHKFSDKAAVPGINRNHLHEEPVVVPPRPVQTRFGQLAGEWLERKAKNDEAINLLAALRDTLLPKLLSGELRIPEAEAAVGKAL